jgi:hypothetical protein
MPALVEAAKLPASYEFARDALAKCERVDECQKWADKAKALASYAKQAEDESLHHYADRIKARAVRRGGELLAKIKPSKGGRPFKEITRAGADPSYSRNAAAAAAGVSPRQQKTMLRVAAVPAAEFERQVESERPPTVTALAQQGARRQATRSANKQSGKGRGSVFIEEPDEEASTDQSRWQRSAGSMLGELLSLRAYWRKEFGKWETFEIPTALVTLAKQAAEELSELAKQLSRSK